jgi:MFS superfamily sulfate permease-like transporter
MRPDQADSLILAVAALTNALVGIGTAIVLAILSLVLAVSSLRRMLGGRVTPEPRKGGAPADRL